MIVRVCGHFLVDGNDHKRTYRIGGRKVADRCPVLIPVGRWVELRAILVGAKSVAGGDEAVLVVGIFFSLLHIARDVGSCRSRLELGLTETWPDRLNGREGMGEVDMLGAFEALLVDGPQSSLLLGWLLRKGSRRKESAGEQSGG